MKTEMQLILDYEIRSSWFAKYIGNTYLQKLASRYFAWKVKRKYARYRLSKIWQEHIKQKNLASLRGFN